MMWRLSQKKDFVLFQQRVMFFKKHNINTICPPCDYYNMLLHVKTLQ